MSILSGFLKTKKHRKMADGNYKLQSEWTSASTVEMADGNTAETNLGAIQGITDSLTATSSNIALSAKAGNNLQGQIDTVNSNLNQVSNNLVWKFHKQVSGTEVIYLPTVPYNELKFMSIIEFMGIQYVFSTNIARIEIENNGDYYRFYLNGGYSVNLYTDYRLAINSQIATLNTLFINGEAFTNDCVTFCYYR